MPPDDKTPSAAATGQPAANSAAAPAADSAAPARPADSSSNSDSVAAAASSSTERPAAYEGSEPSLLQTTAANEPPKAEAAPAAAADAKKPAAAEAPSKGEQAKEAKAEDKTAAKPEDGAKPAEPKAGEVKPAEAAKPEGDKTAPPAPVEYKYALPETIKLDDAAKTQLHTVLDTFRADPANVQPLIDYHTERMAEHAKQVDAHNRTVFNEMRAENRKAIMADPVLGGSGHQTTAQAVARMRDMLIPKEMLAPRKFDDGKPRLSIADEFLESTGAGDHPVLWHILHNAARYLDEPQAMGAPSNIQPPKDLGKRPKGRLRDLYDHPRSNGQT